MAELLDNNSNEIYVDLRVHFTQDLIEDGEGGGIPVLRATRITQEDTLNISYDELSELSTVLEEALNAPDLETLADVICYGAEITLD